MDWTERPENKGRVSQRHVGLCGSAILGASMLHFPLTLFPHSRMVEKEVNQKKLVSQQEIIPQESWSIPGKRGLSSNLKGR